MFCGYFWDIVQKLKNTPLFFLEMMFHNSETENPNFTHKWTWATLYSKNHSSKFRNVCSQNIWVTVQPNWKKHPHPSCLQAVQEVRNRTSEFHTKNERELPSVVMNPLWLWTTHQSFVTMLKEYWSYCPKSENNTN